MKTIKQYAKGIIVVVSSLVVLNGCNDKTESVIQPSVVLEQHVITAIEGNDIYGENVNGKGEGIYYTKQDFIKLGIDVNELNIGDVVEIGWNEVDYVNEEWDQVALLVMVE